MNGTTITVDTYGWHTVSAVTYTEVNRAIAAAAGAFPASFSLVSSDGTITAAGNFSSWAVTFGGSGAKIAMSLALSGGSITSGGTTRNANSCTIVIQVEAGFIPQPNTGTFFLSLQAEQDVNIMTTAQQFGTLSGLQFLDASNYLSLLRDWLAANMDQFNHVFATVDLNPQFASIPNADFTWLTPSWYSYAVAEPASNKTADNCVFAVLCLIDNTQPPPNLVQQVSNNTVPAGQKAAFLLAPGIFLKHIMFGATPLMFSGLTVSDAAANFTIDSNGTRIISTQNLTLLPLALQNGKTVNPTVNSGNFTVSASGTELLINISDMQFNWSPGIDIHLTYTGNVSVGYNTASGHLVLNLDNQSASTPNAVTQPWLNDLNISVGVIGGIAALVGGIGGVVSVVRGGAQAAQAGAQVGVGAADAGLAIATAANIAQDVNQGATLAARVATFLRIAAFVTLGGAVAALPAIITQILTAIATGEYSSVPKVADLTNAAVGKVVTWPASVGSYFLKTAQLNGALIFVLG
jgi:hypothetical protein